MEKLGNMAHLLVESAPSSARQSDSLAFATKKKLDVRMYKCRLFRENIHGFMKFKNIKMINS